MIDYRFQGRLTYIGGGLNVQMSAWPAADEVGTSPGTTGLLAWWALDETSGTRADSHSGGYDMSVQGTPSYTTGKKSNAGTVSVTNGAGSYFYYTDTGNALDCPAGSSITVCFWVYLNNLPSNNAYPVNRWGEGTSNNSDWAVNIYSTGAIEGAAGRISAQTNAKTAAGVIGATTWYFITYIFNHAVGTYGTVSITVNNGTPTSAALPSAKVAGSGLPVSIGDLSHTRAAYGNMSGAVDEVCVYQRVLTSDEIAWLYNEGNGRAYSDLLPGSIAPAGLAVAAAFGTATVGRGTVDIEPAGLAVGLGVGSAAVTVGAADIAPDGYAVGAAFGSATVATGVVDIAPDGLAVAVGLGSAAVSVGAADVAPDGLSVAVAIGAAAVYLPGVGQDIEPAGLAVGVGLGAATVTRRPAAVIPLYEIDLDVRTWRVPAESRVYVAEA